MGPLIRRELDGLVTISLKNSLQTYLVLGLVFVMLMWLLGPNVTGLFITDMISLLLFIVGFLSAGVNMLSLLENDDANRQLSFLQTLPVRKTDIVHAKFLSTLLLCGFVFIWTSVLVSANLLINDVWTIESWMIVFPFLAVLMLLVSGNLLWYYFQGSMHSGWINYALVIGGTMILLYLGFNKPSGQSQTFLYSLSLSLSVLVYLIIWLIVTVKVHQKGFAKEAPNPEREKTNKRIEELKRRHAEHESKKSQGK